jgi:hypothetical protein
MARLQSNVDLPGRDEAWQQIELNHRRFTDYLLGRHHSRIVAIHIMRR